MSDKKHDENFESFLERITTVLPFCAVPPDDDAMERFAPILKSAGGDTPAFFAQCADDDEHPTMKFIELFNRQRGKLLGNLIADSLIECNESLDVGRVDSSDMYYVMTYDEKNYVVQHQTDIFFGNERPTQIIDYFHSQGLFEDDHIDGFVVIKNKVFITLTDDVDKAVQEADNSDTLLEHQRFLIASAHTRMKAATMIFYTVVSLSSETSLLRLTIPDHNEGVPCDLETFKAKSKHRLAYLASKLNVDVDIDIASKSDCTVH